MANFPLVVNEQVSNFNDINAWIRALNRVTTAVFDVREQGATGDGVTDDLADINAVGAALNAIGGGVRHWPNGTYLVGVSTTDWVIAYDNVTDQLAPGATIKVKDDAGNYSAVIAPAGGYFGNLSDYRMTGGTIDQNADGNTTSTIQTGDVTKKCGAFGCGISARIAFDGVRFKDACGVNTVSVNGVGTEDLTFVNCTGNWKQGATATPDYDNSFLYFNGRGATVTGNKLKSAIVERPLCAFETHGSGVTVANNETDGFNTLANIVTGVDTITESITVANNTALNANRAVSLWSLAGKTLKGVTITGNTGQIKQLAWDENNAWGFALIAQTGITGEYEGIIEADNVWTFEQGDTRTVDRNAVALSSFNAAVGLWARGVVRNSRFGPDTIIDAPNHALMIGWGLPTLFEGCQFSESLIVDCGRNSSLANRAALWLQGDFTDCDVRRHKIRDTGNPTQFGQYWIIANAGLGTCTKLRVIDNEVWNANGTMLLRSIDATKVITLWASQSIDFPSIAAGAVNAQTVTVLGAAAGDHAIVNSRSALATGLTMNPPIVSADSVSIRLFNPTTGAIDQGAVVFDVRVIKTGVSTL